MMAQCILGGKAICDIDVHCTFVVPHQFASINPLVPDARYVVRV